MAERALEECALAYADNEIQTNVEKRTNIKTDNDAGFNGNSIYKGNVAERFEKANKLDCYADSNVAIDPENVGQQQLDGLRCILPFLFKPGERIRRVNFPDVANRRSMNAVTPHLRVVIPVYCCGR